MYLAGSILREEYKLRSDVETIDNRNHYAVRKGKHLAYIMTKSFRFQASINL